MIDLTPIINAVIAMIAAIIAYKLIPWIKARTTSEQQATVAALIKVGVFAAEQLYSTPGMGKDKLQFVQKYLAAHGYTVDVAQIEAAVGEYINAIGQPIQLIEPVTEPTAPTAE